jgi:hypothetical protein
MVEIKTPKPEVKKLVIDPKLNRNNEILTALRLLFVCYLLLISFL